MALLLLLLGASWPHCSCLAWTWLCYRLTSQRLPAPCCWRAVLPPCLLLRSGPGPGLATGDRCGPATWRCLLLATCWPAAWRCLLLLRRCLLLPLPAPWLHPRVARHPPAALPLLLLKVLGHTGAVRHEEAFKGTQLHAVVPACGGEGRQCVRR